MEKTTLFEYIDSLGYKNQLIITKKGNTLQGVFWGVELNTDNKPIYYKSVIKNGFINNDKLSFVLNNYEFSNKPINLDSVEVDPLTQSYQIPLILQYNLYFNGTITKKTIEFNRTSDLYDSRFDKIIFSKQ